METLETWLSSSQVQRDALFAHAKSPIPTDRGSLDGDIELSIRAAEAAGAQLAKAKYYLTGALSDAWKNVKTLYPDASIKELDAHIKDQIKGVQLLTDEIENLAKSLTKRTMAELNSRRSLL